MGITFHELHQERRVFQYVGVYLRVIQLAVRPC